MRVMIDMAHPAHVLFYRNLIEDLHGSGHTTLLVARDKEVVHALLDGFGLEYEKVGKAGRKGIARLGAELVTRVARLVWMGLRFRPDAVLTRNPAGVIAAWMLRVPGVFDTDDGRKVGIYWTAAAPFASVITTPETVTDDFRGKRLAYRSHKALAYLHPDRFEPDPSVRDELGVATDERYAIVRFVAMAAYHDRAETGVSSEIRSEVVARLSQHGRVFISSENPLPASLAAYRFPLPPHRLHHALAFASVHVGDSQSMTSEAACLGVPTVRLSSWSGRLPGLKMMAEQFGLVFEYTPDQADAFLAKVDEVAAIDDRGVWQQRREALLEGKVDLTAWYRDLVLSLPRKRREVRRRLAS